MIREDVERQINKIREQLGKGQATLMIGAGFSRNADTASPNTPVPPTWSELKREFVNGLYGNFREQYREEMNNSKSVLQLAQEYDKLFERVGLNSLLKKLIRDAEIFPSSIHEEILKLPWRDVFTTNYDTLLERAATHVVERKYTPVYCCDDLSLSTPPRIIKLHGSIQTEATHLILTEEDYRRYPSDYAPFVNTVQQAIMETTLCLVGFSGTDPNFLKWIGWVRDNLKDSMPPVYLIGNLNISDSEYRVLMKYKINPVDLSVFGRDRSHKELLTDFIYQITPPPPPTEWDLSKAPLFPTQQIQQNPEVREKEIIELRSKWEKQREEYHNWFVTPSKYREALVARTERWSCIPQWCSELPQLEDLRLLYEYNWRIEHCLMPIIDSDVKYYEKILKRHNPLGLRVNINGDEYFSQDAIVANDDDTNCASQCYMWIQLMLAMLRWQREVHNKSGFEKYKLILKEAVTRYPEYLERLYYEQALFELSTPDLKALTKTMSAWKRHLSSPEWILKYAALTAELGNAAEANDLLKELLPVIRQAIPRDSIIKDFYYLGLEGVALTGLIMYEQGKPFSAENNGNDESEDGDKDTSNQNNDCTISPPPVEVGESNRSYPPRRANKQPNNASNADKRNLEKKYNQRLINLRASYCNPKEELHFFKLSMSRWFQQESGEVEKRDFDRTTKLYCSTYGWNKNLVIAYQFLRYLEDTGLPLHFNHVALADKTLVEAATRIAQSSPELAFSAFNRGNSTDTDKYEPFFSQSAVHDIPHENAEAILARYIETIIWLIDNACDKINEPINNFYNTTFKNLLEVVSRLTVRASEPSLQRVFDLIIKLYNCDIKDLVIEKPLRHCVERLFESISRNMLRDNIEKLLQISLPDDKGVHFFVNPFDYVDKSTRLEKKVTDKIITALDVWLDRLNADNDWLRKIAQKVLFVSDELGLMTNDQRKRFAQNFFSKLDSDGLPADTDFYPWVFLKVARFLGPAKDVEEKLLKRYKDFTFEFDCNASWNRPADYRFEMNCYSMLLNMSITRGAPEFRLSYTSDDTWEIFKHIKSAIEKLKQHIDGLEESKKSAAIKNIRNNLLHIDRIVGEIVIPSIKNQTQRKTQVKNFIRNAGELQAFPTSRIALLQRSDAFPAHLAKDFVLAISSTDRDLFNLYSWAMLNAYIRANKKNGPVVPSAVFFSLVAAVGMRTDNIFRLACQTITAILDYCNMNQQECDLLLQYLEMLEKETLFSTQNSRFPYDSRYDYRIAAAGLAARIFKAYYDKDPSAMPPVLTRWNEICHSPDEFPNLRNKWDGVINHAQ